MDYLILLIQSEIRSFLNEYLPIQNLTDPQLVGIGVLLFLAVLLGYIVYRSRRIGKVKESSYRKNRRSVKQREQIETKKNLTSKSKAASKSDKNSNKRSKTTKRRQTEIVKGINSSNSEKKNESSETRDYKSSSISNSFVQEKGSSYTDKKRRRKRTQRIKSSSVDKTVKKNQKNDKVLYIGYTPSDKFQQPENWKYAVVKMPDKNSVIRQPVEGKQQLRGYKEEEFQDVLESSFPEDFSITGNALISTGNETRPYEPDICISCLSGGRNIFIDVEIDEPYGGITRSATHIKGEDDIRDYYFTDRGWIVIRFAEIQVHKQPQRCLGLIAKVVQEIAPELNLPDNLLAKDLPSSVEQWDILQAQKWENDNYRESYLNHSFGHQRKLNKEDSAVEMREIDLKVEKEVTPTTYLDEEHEPANGQINLQNWSKRDSRIQFFPEKHVYLIDGVQAKSVTEVVERFFPAFDRQGISRRLSKKRGVPQSEILEKWDRARDQGTHLHLQIENYFNDDEYEEPPEFDYFLNFMNDHSDLNTFRTEWRVFDDKRLMAGTIDYVAKNKDGTFSIYDWKRSKNIVDEWNGGGPKTSHPFGNGFGKLSHIDSTSYNKYCLQQGVYKEILERYYGITIRDMHLVVIHPRYSDYHKFKVPVYVEEVEHIMNAI